MENISKINIDDSCTSMYFSFNSTSANKTVETMESITELSCMVDISESEQNVTLEADENNDAPEKVQTVKKISFGVSPLKAIPKNIMQAYKTLSSTPTKAQLMRSVEVTRGSAAVDVCDLGIAFLEAPQESINAALSEDKENQPSHESHEIYSETSSEIVVSVIEKTQEEEKPVPKKVGFSNLPVLKTSSNNMNVRCTPKPTKINAKCEPDINTNRPSRIIPKRFSLSSKNPPASNKEFGEDDVPKMINSMVKISGALPNKGKPSSNPEKPFNLLGKATRMSIVKTTLNSPARKAARKSITLVQPGRNTVRQSVGQVNKRMTMVPNVTSNPRRSAMPSTTRRSVMPPTVTSPSKRIIPSTSRKSILPVKAKTLSSIPTSRKSLAVKAPTPIDPPQADQKTKPQMPKAPPSDIREEFACDVCNRKFRVHSLFESHKKTHNSSGASSKQTFSGNDKQCRYCDKKFAIAKALTNHLLEKCTKIPPGDKKKLLFPSDHPQVTDTSKHRAQISKNSTILSSCDSLASNATQISTKQTDNDRSMLPPSGIKIKKKVPHSGVYCTPNKMISCHVCKLSFANILAFAEHSLTHTTSPNEAPVLAANESTQTHIEVKNDSTQTPGNEVVVPK